MKPAFAELAKTNPKVYGYLSKLAKGFEEEQARMAMGLEEIKEQAKMASVKSMMRMRRTQAASKHQAIPDAIRRTSTMDDIVRESPILKQETMNKQGRDVTKWRPRHFVLRPEGVFYYETEKDFKLHPEKPRGCVMFVDLVCPSGKAADEVPRFYYMILNAPHVFCLHTEDRTFIVSAPSKDSLKSWVSSVNSAFEKFINQQAQKNALLQSAWIVATPDVWSVTQKLTTNNASVEQVLSELVGMLDEQFADEVWVLRQQHTKRRALEIWRSKVRRSKMKDPITKASDIS